MRPLVTFAIVLYALAAFLVLIPVIWHAKQRNIAICSICGWLGLNAFIFAVNMFLWPEVKNPVKTHPIWCEAAIRGLTISELGLIGSCLAVSYYLASIVRRTTAFVETKQMKRRRLAIECLLCFGWPVVYAILEMSYFREYRYSITPLLGCTRYIKLTRIQNVVWYTPIIAAVLAMSYHTGVLLVALVRRWRVSADSIRSSTPSMTVPRFLRFGAVIFTANCVLLPVSIQALYSDIKNLQELEAPWFGRDFHDEILIFYVQPIALPPLAFLNAGMTLIAFALFGLGRDSIKMYKEWAQAIYPQRVMVKISESRFLRRFHRGRSVESKKPPQTSVPITQLLSEKGPHSVAADGLSSASSASISDHNSSNNREEQIRALSRGHNDSGQRREMKTTVWAPKSETELECDSGVLHVAYEMKQH